MAENDGQRLSFDEILEDKEYQSEFDRRVQKALDTAKTKWQGEADTAAATAQASAIKEATDPLHAKIKDLVISAEATKYGAKDPADILPLLDREKVTIDGDKVDGLTDQFDAIKEKKAYLFHGEEPPKGKSGLPHGGSDPKDDDERLRRAMGLKT